MTFGHTPLRYYLSFNIKLVPSESKVYLAVRCFRNVLERLLQQLYEVLS